MPIPPELANACADVRLAEDADTIAGRPARYVAAPDSTAEASALLRAVKDEFDPDHRMAPGRLADAV
jgi:FAD/FMN-containing dehydrogenase